jgi:UDP-N-acetylglucosamine 2-epimerase (hydrolysing)
MNKKKILFLTGTRADFGKQQSLIEAAEKEEKYDVSIFITGMHMEPRYGSTVKEVLKCNFRNVYSFINQRQHDSMETILANTVHGLGNYIYTLKPDMIVVHGDRIEALAGAIVGALNNLLVVHIEGGEVSGTIDESIRHSVSKLAHIHLVANDEAKKRLIQMGEKESNIYIIGSPDLDLMTSSSLPSLESVKKDFDISFGRYAIFMYHPVTSSLHSLLDNIQEVMKAVVASEKNFVVVCPNNDPGSEIIMEELEMLKENHHFRIFPSIRFKAFLVLLKNCEFIIGNSSAGVREAPFYAIPTINIGTRQNGRYLHTTIIDVTESKEEILSAMEKAKDLKPEPSNHFGDGMSTERFMRVLKSDKIWIESIQKQFVDFKFNE